MKKLFGMLLAGSLLASGTAFADSHRHYYNHDVEPQVGVEVQMVRTQPNTPFEFRSLLGVIIPGVGVEVHMGDLISAEQAAAIYDPDGVPDTWRAINPPVGVEKHMLQ